VGRSCPAKARRALTNPYIPAVLSGKWPPLITTISEGNPIFIDTCISRTKDIPSVSGLLGSVGSGADFTERQCPQGHTAGETVALCLFFVALQPHTPGAFDERDSWRRWADVAFWLSSTGLSAAATVRPGEETWIIARGPMLRELSVVDSEGMVLRAGETLAMASEARYSPVKVPCQVTRTMTSRES